MKAKTKRAAKPPAPDAATDQARVAQVLAIVLDGAEAWDIRQFVLEKHAAAEPPWQGEPVSEKQLAGYLADAEQQLARSTGTKADDRALKTHLAKTRGLYAKAVSQGDIRAALSCLRHEGAILGLDDRKQRRRPAVAALTGPANIAGLLADTIKQMRAGTMDPRTAATIGGLAALLLRARGEDDQADEARQLLDLRNLEKGGGDARPQAQADET